MGQLTPWGGVIDEINKNVTTLKETVDGHTTSIGTLETDMNSVESELETHQTSINEIASSVSSALTRISTNESSISSLSSNKQDKLVSGTNIKTINGNSIVGSGNVTIEAGKTYTAGSGISISSSGVISTTVPIGTYSTYLTVPYTLDEIPTIIEESYSAYSSYSNITTQKIGNSITTTLSGSNINKYLDVRAYSNTSDKNITVDFTSILGNKNGEIIFNIIHTSSDGYFHKPTDNSTVKIYVGSLSYSRYCYPFKLNVLNGIASGTFKGNTTLPNTSNFIISYLSFIES